jgi:uncharacterized protein YkwD
MAMKKIYSIVLAFVLFMFCLPLQGFAANDNTDYAALVFELTNEARKENGLRALKNTNAALNRAAQKRATEIAVSFSHTRPNNKLFSSVLVENGIAYNLAGENIAYGQTSAEMVVREWMNSEGHRANILGNYIEIGVGVYEKNGVIYWAQEFVRSNSGANTQRSGWDAFVQWFIKWILFGWIWQK